MKHRSFNEFFGTQQLVNRIFCCKSLHSEEYFKNRK
jgi:hypothetical protein